jgi:hypothetical protein
MWSGVDPRLAVIDAVREKLRAAYETLIEARARQRCRPRGTDPKELEQTAKTAWDDVQKWEAALTVAISYAVEIRTIGSGSHEL